MKSINCLVIVFLMAGVVPGAIADVRRSGSACAATVAATQTVVVCQKDFPALWRDAKALDKTYIRITGFVADVEGHPYLFASKDLYLYSGGRGGIALEFEPGDRARFEKWARGNHAVTVAGKFVEGDEDNQPGSLGRLHILDQSYWPQELPGEPPAPPPR